MFPKTSGYLHSLPPEVRAVINYLEDFLPDFPSEEIEVYQDTSQVAIELLAGVMPEIHPGLVRVQRMSSYNVVQAGTAHRESPHRMQLMIARQLAGQYWGQSTLPASSRERWLLNALSDTYAYLYIRGVHGFEAYADMMKEVRLDLEKPEELFDYRTTDWRRSTAARRAMALTAPPMMTDVPERLREAYGVYVLAEMLRNRLGDEVFFSALESLAVERRGQRVTTEMMQNIFEQQANQDLSDFFDYWIHGGFFPKITVTIPRTVEDGWLRGCVETNIPYGAFDVPVRILDRDGERIHEALVDVKEGKGHFQLSALTGEIDVELDPYGMVLAKKRQVRRVDALPCASVFEAEADATLSVEETLEY